MAVAILADAARLLVNLGSLGQNFTGVGSPGFSGEYLAASVTSMSADGLAGGAALAKLGGLDGLTRIRFEGGSVKVPSPPGSKQSLKTAGSLILWALTVVELMELTTGFGPPVEGDDLRNGSQQFSTLAAQLKSAIPDNDGWEGSASDAYAGLDTALQNLAQTMAELDLELAALVKDQAEWVTHMRLGFGILKDLLFACYLVELIIRFAPPPLGPAVSQGFAIAVSALGIAAAVGFLTTLTTYSVLNGKKADALAGEYSALATGTVQTGSPAKAKVTTAAESTVSSFDAVSGSMSGVSAFSELPTVAALARLTPTEGASAQDLATLSAFSADAAPTPVAETPAVTPPTMAQVAQASAQAAKVSGQASQHMNLANQTVGQAQQLAQMGQQGQPAGEDAPAEDAEAAGPAAGAEGAERAPLEHATLDTGEGSGRHTRVP
ncbi:hypothetical protein KXD96_02840 [Mycobacterium sp. SMC-2]|uniref:EspA/EspE family type VII secretion system effector n=1 Tax=Mycobacterium sp. SMC-2 TaxID=2857058 RepID=UPI0021B3D0EB|nr:EspA/EspE family type VII secretion system effector [Mycobacterium sp. SMC-2]UXA07114.1 hypothetical protein KXD96_02840 [Mycobacterium sp. SMC-2]